MKKVLIIVSFALICHLFANENVNSDLQELSDENSSEVLVQNNEKSCFSRTDVNKEIKIKDYKSYKIEILVEKRIMNFYGIEKTNDPKLIHTFTVATPKTTVEYPTQIGKVLKVDLNPWWYPTELTRDEFKKHKNICLPKAVCPGDKQNYMGTFKITLSNSTKERGSVYRIHGNVDDRTIGKRASGGCVRMHNNEGKEFAILVRDILKQGKQISVLYI